MQLPCNPAVMPSPPLPFSSDPPLPQTLSLDHETFSLRSLRSLSVNSFCVCLSVYLTNKRNGDMSIACCCSKLQIHNPSKVCLLARTNPQTLIAHTLSLSLLFLCLSVYLRNKRNGDISTVYSCSKLQTHNPTKLSVCLREVQTPKP